MLSSFLIFPAGPASAVLAGSRVEGNARSGVSSFGSSLSIEDSVLECNTIHLDGEVFQGLPATFEDRGGAVCGCAGAEVDCKVLSSNLAPPVPSAAE